MASGLKKFVWGNSGQVSPKHVEETILSPDDQSLESLNSYRYSENSDSVYEEVSCLDCSMLMTLDEGLLEKTIVLTTRDSISNLREVLNNFKSKAAIKIQRFMKQRNLNKHLYHLSDILSTVFKSKNLLTGLKEIKAWCKYKEKCAFAIQKA